MQKPILVLLLLLTAFVVSGEVVRSKATLGPVPVVPDRVIRALIMVESSDRDYLVGDKRLKNKAYGPLQIRENCVRDVNRRLGTSYTARQMNGNRSLSVYICRAYLSLYATKENVGRTPTSEDMCRIWNGGPHGWKNPKTVTYWSRAKSLLQLYAKAP